MTDQQITPGRIVTYCEVSETQHPRADWPAIITRVNGNGTVDLTVCSPLAGNGTYVARDVPPAPDKASKEFGQDGAPWPPSNTWRWPERV